MSNMAKREELRRTRHPAGGRGSIAGLGWRPTLLALRWLVEMAREASGG